MAILSTNNKGDQHRSPLLFELLIGLKKIRVIRDNSIYT